MTATPPSDEQRAGLANLFNNRLAPKDQRQHSPCRSCYSDCVSYDETLILQFHCTNCGKEHTNTRAASLNHSRWISSLKLGTEPNR